MGNNLLELVEFREGLVIRTQVRGGVADDNTTSYYTGILMPGWINLLPIRQSVWSIARR